jgi:hypothetical protein
MLQCDWSCFGTLCFPVLYLWSEEFWEVTDCDSLILCCAELTQTQNWRVQKCSVHYWWTSNINERPKKIPYLSVVICLHFVQAVRCDIVPDCPHRYQLRVVSEQWQGSCFVMCVAAACVAEAVAMFRQVGSFVLMEKSNRCFELLQWWALNSNNGISAVWFSWWGI